MLCHAEAVSRTANRASMRLASTYSSEFVLVLVHIFLFFFYILDFFFLFKKEKECRMFERMQSQPFTDQENKIRSSVHASRHQTVRAGQVSLIIQMCTESELNNTVQL